MRKSEKLSPLKTTWEVIPTIGGSMEQFADYKYTTTGFHLLLQTIKNCFHQLLFPQPLLVPNLKSVFSINGNHTGKCSEIRMSLLL